MPAETARTAEPATTSQGEPGSAPAQVSAGGAASAEGAACRVGGLCPIERGVSWLAQIAAAAILGQTLFFKFTGAKEAVAIFSALGVEPWGRYMVGTFEAIAVVLLLVPATAWFGGLMSIGLMVGAIGSHITVLGIESQGDGGTLFILAWVVLACGIAISYVRRSQVPFVGPTLKRVLALPR